MSASIDIIFFKDIFSKLHFILFIHLQFIYIYIYILAFLNEDITKSSLTNLS